MSVSTMPCLTSPQSRSRAGSGLRTPHRSTGRREEAVRPALRLIPAERDEPGRLSDEALLARYRDERCPKDFAELHRRYAEKLGRYLSRYIGDPVLAEDVLQDTFLQVHAKCGLYHDGWPARAWLYSVAIHQAIDAGRRSRRFTAIRLDPGHGDDRSVERGSLVELLAGAGPGPLEELQEQERQCWVRDSVQRLPGGLRQVLVLAYDQDLTYAEIAELLDIPVGTVKSRLHNAIARLREMAERHDRAGRH